MNELEPTFPAVAVDAAPPEELAGDVSALSEWARVYPLLEQARVITEADRGSLVALCQQWSRYLEATQKVKVSGMVVQSPSGYPLVNPYLSIAGKALAFCLKLWAELGLTPSSRSKVTTTPMVGWTGHPQVAKPQSKLAELQASALELRRPMGVK